MFVEFLIEHYLLVSGWLTLVFLLLFHENRKAGKSVGPHMLSQLVNQEDGVVVDIRDAKDYKLGHITNAVNIPFRDVERRIGELNEYKSKPVIVVCKIGQHSGAATKILKANGFESVHKLTGGMGEWTAASLPVVK